MTRLLFILLSLCFLGIPGAQAADSPSTTSKASEKNNTASESDAAVRVKPIVIYQTPKDLRVGGSAHKMDEKDLKRQKYDAPDQALYTVPGVYIRPEDGYGLRPNIGLRGANSDRSKKVTLMEDGLLFGPAPYSAPAAYYFPLMTRLTGMDVIKGPAAILYGPQTIGGALNLFTRDLPRRGHKGAADLSYGLYNSSKVHAHHGWSGSRGGFLVEGVNLMTDGFKELDGGGDTGFSKQEAMVKGRLTSDPLGEVFHRWDIKLGFSNEISNETYLGLTDADFEANPFRRYRSSALDQMNLMRFQAETSYTLQLDENFDLNAAFYWRSMSRSWRKLNRFKTGPSLADILASPDGGVRKVYFDVLTGSQDSGSDDETLMIGDNARDFLVLGGQLSMRYEFDMGDFSSEIRAGLRYHMDQIERNHTEDGYLMESQQLVSDGEETVTTVLNRGKTNAIAGFVHYGLFGYGLTVTPGLRFEHVQTGLLNRFTDELQENETTTLLPGLGLHYELVEGLGVFAGAYRGFSPVAPGQAQEVMPETSVNYEAGLRYAMPATRTRLEAIGFFNDYSNLVGQCSFSSGCAPDDLAKQFNGGEVDIYGVELVAGHRFELSAGLSLDIQATYTLTKTEFQSAFTSSNPQFGKVEVGDELPYVPVHQASLQLGVGQREWALDISFVYCDAMREVAGLGTPAENEVTDSFLMLDARARYQAFEWLEIYLKGENLTLTEAIASRRPFGARPIKPLLVSLGASVLW